MQSLFYGFSDSCYILVMKIKNNYVNNDRLSELVAEYVISNPTDRGEWLDKYERTMTTKHANKNPKKMAETLDFIQFRRELYSHERPFNKYDSVCKQLIPMLYEIIDGRMASYKIFNDDDMRQECIVMVLRYMNRFDWRKKTSAFAYITEVITNAINMVLKQRKEDSLDGNVILESDLNDKYGNPETIAMFKGLDYGNDSYD